MWADSACAVLAPELPHLKCDGNAFVFHRPDIFCEFLLWQSEQLGRGSEAEFNALRHVEECASPAANASVVSKQQPHRYGGRLNQNQLPRWARELPGAAFSAEL